MPDDWVRTPAQQAAIDLQATIDGRHSPSGNGRTIGFAISDG